MREQVCRIHHLFFINEESVSEYMFQRSHIQTQALQLMAKPKSRGVAIWSRLVWCDLVKNKWQDLHVLFFLAQQWFPLSLMDASWLFTKIKSYLMPICRFSFLILSCHGFTRRSLPPLSWGVYFRPGLGKTLGTWCSIFLGTAFFDFSELSCQTFAVSGTGVSLHILFAELRWHIFALGGTGLPLLFCSSDWGARLLLSVMLGCHLDFLRGTEVEHFCCLRNWRAAASLWRNCAQHLRKDLELGV